MTIPKTMPEFPIEEIFPKTCSFEDAARDRETMREWKEQMKRCHKARASRVYAGIMSLAGGYERERTIK